MIYLYFPIHNTNVFFTDTLEARFIPSYNPWFAYEQLERTGTVSYSSSSILGKFPYIVSGVGWKHILVYDSIIEQMI
jgi:hypothetical protein